MAKDSQGLAFSPYKDDAQRVAQTNNDIILQNSAKGGADEQGSKLEQAEARQEVVKGEGWTMKDGGEANLEIYEGNGVIDFSSKIDDDFLRANATELEPSSNLFDFLAKTKNNPSRDKILNHFPDIAGERDSKALEPRMA